MLILSSLLRNKWTGVAFLDVELPLFDFRHRNIARVEWVEKEG